MKKLTALILSLVMALSLTACGGGEAEKSTIDKILEQGYITMATSPDFAPSEFKDPITGEVMGTDIEYGKYVAKYISEKYGKPVELKIEEMDFKSCQAAVSTNAVNFSLSGYAETPERAQNYHCVGPYAVLSDDEGYHGALVKKGLKLETAEDFKGLKIGCQQASLQYNLAMEQLPIDEMEEIEFITNLTQGAMMVKTDKIDALITANSTGDLLVLNDPDILEMAAFHFEYSEEGNCGLVNINEVELAELITEALLAAEREIDYAALRDDMTRKAKALGISVE